MRCLRLMLPRDGKDGYQLPNTIDSIELMVRSVIPDFEHENSANRDAPLRTTRQSQPQVAPSSSLRDPTSGAADEPFLYPSMPFGVDINGAATGQLPMMTMPGEQMDFTAADMGWDVDFSTMDMEAFLSIDANNTWGFRA